MSTVLCTKSLFYDDDNDDVLRFFKIILAHLTANTSLSFFEQSSFAHWDHDVIYNLPLNKKRFCLLRFLKFRGSPLKKKCIGYVQVVVTSDRWI